MTGFFSFSCALHLNAAKEFLYAQKDALIDVVLANLPEISESESAERPTLHIRAHSRFGLHGEVSAIWFLKQRPDETADQAENLVEHGLADLCIAFQALAESRTLVTVSCLATSFLPAARAVLRELASRYPEAREDVERCLGEAATGKPPDPPRLPQRPKDRVRWQATWEKVRAEWRRGKSYEDICAWLRRVHPELACNPDTLRDIIVAGEAGLLGFSDTHPP